MSRWFFVPLSALVFGACAYPANAQEAAAPPDAPTAPITAPQEPILFARTLQLFRTTPISVAPFGYAMPAQCDAAGRMYFNSFTPPSNEHTYFSIGPDGTGQIAYAIPQDLDKEPHNDDFSVESNGKVDLLVMLPGSSLTWLRYNVDGSLNSRTKLDVSSELDLESPAVTDSGYLFLMAHYPEDKRHPEDSGKTWRGIFRPTGDLVTNFPVVTLEKPGSLPKERVTAVGEKFYWASDHSIVVMDTTGNVEREVAFHKPDEKDRVSGLQISGNMAEITLTRLKPDGHNLTQSYLVVDLTSGNAYGLYLPPEEGPRILTCFDGSRGFTFLEPMNHREMLGQALLP